MRKKASMRVSAGMVRWPAAREYNGAAAQTIRRAVCRAFPGDCPCEMPDTGAEGWVAYFSAFTEQTAPMDDLGNPQPGWHTV
jgi:hypothetical protein